MQCFCCLDLLIIWDIYGYLDILGSWSKWLAWISLAWLNMLNWHKCPVFKAIWMTSHCFDGVRCQLQRKAHFPFRTSLHFDVTWKEELNLNCLFFDALFYLNILHQTPPALKRPLDDGVGHSALGTDMCNRRVASTSIMMRRLQYHAVDAVVIYSICSL